jgi:signal transduction histidine kinase/CheY-like chemotaxis protein
VPLQFFEIIREKSEKQRFYNDLAGLAAYACKLLKAEKALIVLFSDQSSQFCYQSPDFSKLDKSTQDLCKTLARASAPRDGFVSDRFNVQDGVDGASGLAQGGARTVIAKRVVGKDGVAIGTFLIIKMGSPRLTEKSKDAIDFFVGSVSYFLQLKQNVYELQVADEARKHSEHQLSETEKSFAALARNVPGAIFRYVRHPSGHDEIKFMSPGCITIWGYPAEDLEGDPSLLWQAVLTDDIKAMRASVQQSQDDLTPWQHRWRIRSKAGFLKWLQSYGTPYLAENGCVAWNTLILDVTVEQEAQIALTQNIRLLHEAQKLESIGRLAGGVAHDFNNMLSVIMGNAESISRVTAPADRDEAVAEIIDAAQRGAVLVKQLLSFARRSDLRAGVADIQQVLKAVDKLLRRVLPANISLEVSQRAGLWPVHIDKNMFENALLNIVINACDAMTDGGAITIETSNVRIDQEYIETRDEEVRPGRYVMVAVTDTGRGIEEGALQNLFEPFFTTKGPTDGPGLGLAMVQGFVKQSGGAIRVYTEVGHGTSFKMYFPAVELADGIVDDGAATPPRLGTGIATVLLVEDQDLVRQTVEKAIASAGHRVISASSGDEAIAIFQQRHQDIDIIVTDVVMPGKINGPQFVRLSRKINATIPVLYMSGYPHEANVHGNGVRPGDISLIKPIRRSDLLSALGKLQSQL